MTIKWRKLLFDTLMVVTLPVWIVPAVIFLIVSEVVLAFIDEYTE
jgi:hypothetical protein